MACTCQVSTAWRCRNAGCWKVIEALLWSCLFHIVYIIYSVLIIYSGGTFLRWRTTVTTIEPNRASKDIGPMATAVLRACACCIEIFDSVGVLILFLPNRRKLCSSDSPWMCIAWLLIGQDMSFKAFWFESSSILFWLNKPRIQKRLHMFDTGVDGVRLCLHIGLGCGEAIQAVAVDTTRKLYVLYVWNFGTL